MCGGGEEKRKTGGYMSGGEKENDIKKKKVMGSREWGLRVWWEKRGSGRERRKKFEREKTKLVLFVCSLCLVQSIEL